MGSDMNNNTVSVKQDRDSAYQDLLQEVQHIRDSEKADIETVQALRQVLDDTNQLNDQVSLDERVKNINNTVYDFAILSEVSAHLVACANVVNISNITYDRDIFAAEIVSDVYENAQSSQSLSLLISGLRHTAKNIIPSIPIYSSVYYNSNELMELSQTNISKQHQRRQRSTKDKFRKVIPEQVLTQEQDGTEDQIDNVVKMLFQILCEAYNENNCQPIEYYEYVIDTDSYTNTIENMFYFSFLIKDGRASLALDENNNVIIAPKHVTEIKEFRENGEENFQIVSSINFNTWKKLTKEGFIQKYKKSQ